MDGIFYALQNCAHNWSESSAFFLFLSSRVQFMCAEIGRSVSCWVLLALKINSEMKTMWDFKQNVIIIAYCWFTHSLTDHQYIERSTESDWNQTLIVRCSDVVYFVNKLYTLYLFFWWAYCLTVCMAVRLWVNMHTIWVLYWFVQTICMHKLLCTRTRTHHQIYRIH